MKISVLKEHFSKALNVVSKVVSTKPTLPILVNILIEARPGKIKISATDLDLGINATIGADVDKTGSITVHAKTFSEFINSLSDGRIDIELDGSQIRVTAKGNTAVFNTMDPDDFPLIIQDAVESDISIEPVLLKSAIEQVVFAAAMDDARPALTGIQFEVSGKLLMLVGVDGYRLAKKTIKVESSKNDASPLVPARALMELTKILSEGASENDDLVHLSILENKGLIMFQYGEYELVARLVDAKFPDYKQIIPKEYTTRCIIDYVNLLNAVKITNIFARGVIGNKSIVDINPAQGKLSIQVSLADVGENQSELEISGEGNPTVIAFSTKYLLDMLGHVNCPNIVFESNGTTMPGVFKACDEKGKTDDSVMQIIMPMRMD